MFLMFVLTAAIWSLALCLVWLGTWLAHKHFAGNRPNHASRAEPFAHESPISILKPIKGIDPGLAENLESFFRLDYSRFEIILSVADGQDPAIKTIVELMRKFPRVRAYINIGEIRVGDNPKVNNLVRAYEKAKFDWILISDSNTRVEPDYLKQFVPEMTEDTGIITSIVRGGAAGTLAGELEQCFLNSFYARWMFLARMFGHPVVIGKSMLFRKSQAARFGGLANLGRYLAEDYMAGEAMRMLGLKIKIHSCPIFQPIGAYTFSNFWARHLRWGRIRKAQAFGPFLFEPFLSLPISGILGALALRSYAQVPMVWGLLGHVVIWFLGDLKLNKVLGAKVGYRFFGVWFLRELLALPLWVHILFGNHVNWRGRKLLLGRGGVLRSRQAA